jgi:hypothetical protein
VGCKKRLHRSYFHYIEVLKAKEGIVLFVLFRVCSLFILFIVVLVSLFSCGQRKQISNKLQSKQIEPPSYIEPHNESLSLLASMTLHDSYEVRGVTH